MVEISEESLAFSPDGKRLAAGTFDCAVEIYKTEGDVAMLDGFWRDLGEPITRWLSFPTDSSWRVIGLAGFSSSIHPRWLADSLDPGRIFTIAVSLDVHAGRGGQPAISTCRTVIRSMLAAVIFARWKNC